MSIATAIQNAQQKVANAYTTVSNKGGTLPATQDLTNLSTAIDSIPSGGSDPIGILFQGETDAQGNYTMPYDLTYTGNISFDGIKNISNIPSTAGGAFASYLYHEASQGQRLKCRTIIGTVSFPDLETVNNENCFYSFCNGQTQITGVSFPKLTTVSGGQGLFGYAFQGCTSLTSVGFPELTTIDGNGYRNIFCFTFKNCTSLTSVSFPKLTSISGGSGNTLFQGIFNGCTNLTSVSFPSLTTVSNNFLYYAFQGCTSFTDIYFNSLTGDINSTNALNGITGCTVHLPTDYSGRCRLGGTNTQYVKDL